MKVPQQLIYYSMAIWIFLQILTNQVGEKRKLLFSFVFEILKKIRKIIFFHFPTLFQMRAFKSNQIRNTCLNLIKFIFMATLKKRLNTLASCFRLLVTWYNKINYTEFFIQNGIICLFYNRPWQSSVYGKIFKFHKSSLEIKVEGLLFLSKKTDLSINFCFFLAWNMKTR